MFIWDFMADTILGQILDWIYVKIVGFLANFFAIMNNLGIEIFEMDWVKSVVQLFSYLAWSLFIVGFVVSIFESAIEYQNGKGDIKGTSINILKGFMATSLFTITPIELYKLCVTLQGSLVSDITGAKSIGDLASSLIEKASTMGLKEIMEEGAFLGITSITSNIMVIFILIMMGYAVIKVFFSSLKRSGILLIQIAIGSLYMFSVPRGYIDGFIGWCKQVIAICITAFLQSTILMLGLITIKENALVGLGLMISSGEIPRIAGQFGLDTSSKFNITSTLHTITMMKGFIVRK